jgi:hypothetical protein
MINAKQEYLEHVKGLGPVSCAKITVGDPEYSWIESRDYILKVGFTAEEEQAFIDSLDFEYDAGFGGQELFGTIWFSGGTWSDRDEYDGSEWWSHNSRPEVPKELYK